MLLLRKAPALINFGLQDKGSCWLQPNSYLCSITGERTLSAVHQQPTVSAQYWLRAAVAAWYC